MQSKKLHLNKLGSTEKLSSTTTLDNLTPGQKGIVSSISTANAPLRNRLLTMGIVAGTTIEVLKFAPLGDPLEIRALGYNLSLRVAEASSIQVQLK